MKPNLLLQNLEITDRYGGTGPDPDTMCKGQCEGTGWVPQKDIEAPFLRCPDCDGDGLDHGRTIGEDHPQDNCDGFDRLGMVFIVVLVICTGIVGFFIGSLVCNLFAR